MSRLISRPVILGVTLALSILALARFGILPTILVIVVGVTTAVRVGRHKAGLFTVRKKGARGTGWRPTVQHQELPTPTDDPVIAFAEPTVELFVSRTPPLAHLQLKAGLRSQLDSLALGRTKRIIEAPDLLDRKSTRLNSSHLVISYAVFCLKKKKEQTILLVPKPTHPYLYKRSTIFITNQLLLNNEPSIHTQLVSSACSINQEH